MELLIGYLAKLFGPLLARILVSKLLTSHIDMTELEAIGVSISDVAGDLVGSVDIAGWVDAITDGDAKSRRNADFLFETMGEEAAEMLETVFARERDTLPEGEWRQVVDVAKTTIDTHGLSLLIEKKLDGPFFARALQRIPLAEPLSEAQEAVYTRLLGESAQGIADV